MTGLQGSVEVCILGFRDSYPSSPAMVYQCSAAPAVWRPQGEVRG